MNDEMLRLFTEHEKTDGPPLGVDSDTLARKGRTRLRARRWTGAGGVTAAVAVVAAIAVGLTGLSTPAPADQAADGGVDQPEYPLPELPGPPEKYEWGVADDDDMEPSKAADAYGDAFTGWFADHGIDIESWPGMAVKHRPMFVAEGAEFERVKGDFPPYYGIRSINDHARIDLGGKKSGTIGLLVHPRASFKPGAGETYAYLYHCEDSDFAGSIPDKVDRTCGDGTAATGDEYATVNTHLTGEGRTLSVENRVILYRADGTAVEVYSAVSGSKTSDETPEPKLGFDELTDLALSMPDVVVED